MTLSFTWRTRLIGFAAAILAVWAASDLAGGSYAIPGLLGAAALGGILVYVTNSTIGTLALCAALFGYLVGNRGFAQLMVIPRVPLLPAEIALLAAGSSIALHCVLARRVPFRNDALNWTILAWLVAGTIRVVFDVRPYGLLAIRDFAMVYYAAFFFIAQEIAGDPKSRRFLMAVLIAAALVQPVAAIGSEAFPQFVFGDLSVRGVPLIFFKGDLALTFMAVSAFLLSFGVGGVLRGWAWLLGTIELLYVIGGDNRASMLGAVVALAWVGFSRYRRFTLFQAGALATAFAALVAVASIGHYRPAEQKLNGLSDRVRSLDDVLGTGTYASSESSMKGDNNRFRSLWWGTVYDELMAQDPVFGLGFGYDLARGFIARYNPGIEVFNARSPHSIIVTVLGRMGFAGLLVFLAVFTALARATWRSVRDRDCPSPNLGLWAACWVVLVSACLGVVLEGPMGAVVFWSLLGIANAGTLKPEASAGTSDLRGPCADDPNACPDDRDIPSGASPQTTD